MPVPAVMHFRKARCHRRALWGHRIRVVAVVRTVFDVGAVRRHLVEAEYLAPEEPLAVLHGYRCRFPVDANYATCECSDLWIVAVADA